MKRLAIAFFYDGQGVIDDYYIYLLNKMREHCTRIVLVVNGTLTERSREAAVKAADDLVIRENAGFDVWAYKTGLEFIGYDALGDYDEVILFNHTFFGPIYPLSEMFGAMEARLCDFWGMTAHKAVEADAATNRQAMAFHLNSHFIAVRRSMAVSRPFRDYWENMVPIPSYGASIMLHEIVFTAHFEARGFICAVYVDPNLYGTDYSAFMELDETLLRSRSPILKRRPFFHDPTFVQERGIDLPRALQIVQERSDYPVHLIWQNIVRATNARTLYTNAALLEILPDEPRRGPRADYGRIAVCAHAYYDDLVPEILDHAAAIPGRYDLIVTTDTEEKKRRIQAMAADRPGIDEVHVLVTASRGRDMGALFVSCHDLLTSGRYDLVCRVHTKKSPQVDAALGNMFKRHTLGNVLPGRAGVTAILDMFARNSQLGIVMPPMFHISYPTFGHSWFVNRKRTEAVAKLLNIQVPLDDFSPIATYGGMFWFRPRALIRVFAGWQWGDFEGEPHPIDGALAHALERILVYAAMDQGYVVKTAMTADHAAHNYTTLEFKHNMLAGLLPTGNFRNQSQVLVNNREALRHSFLSGRPSLPPDQGEGIRRQAALDVEALKVLAGARERARLIEAAAVGRLEETCLALMSEGSGSATVDRIQGEVRTLRTYFKAVAAEGDGRAGMPADDALTRYALSHHDRDNDLSPLFDSHWYTQTYPEVGGRATNPLEHFITIGWAKGYAPHPLFNTGFYRSTRPERAQADDVPLRGYLHEGAAARDTPHPLFDPVHYAEQLDGAADVPDLLLHYLRTPEGRQLDPHPLFDAKSYLEACPGLDQTSVAPLAHYVAEGWRAGRNPHPLFDIDYYLSQHPDLSEPGLDPLSHYVLRGWREGLNPHPLFDTRYYIGVNADVREAEFNPLIHFVLYGGKEGRNPHGYFDVNFYRSFYPEVAQSGVNPLIDYLSHKEGDRRHPNRGFDGQSYLHDNPDVALAGINPLVHYVRWGRTEHRRIRPLAKAT